MEHKLCCSWDNEASLWPSSFFLGGDERSCWIEKGKDFKKDLIISKKNSNTKGFPKFSNIKWSVHHCFIYMHKGSAQADINIRS